MESLVFRRELRQSLGCIILGEAVVRYVTHLPAVEALVGREVLVLVSCRPAFRVDLLGLDQVVLKPGGRLGRLHRCSRSSVQLGSEPGDLEVPTNALDVAVSAPGDMHDHGLVKDLPVEVPRYRRVENIAEGEVVHG